MVRDAETYTEVVKGCRTMAEDAMDPGMVDDERMVYDVFSSKSRIAQQTPLRILKIARSRGRIRRLRPRLVPCSGSVLTCIRASLLS